jgi:thiosulfate/3-mercaptopyruvate sulfurtransferase
MSDIEIVLGDITQAHVDAIVNAAHPSLLGGGGVDGAIQRAGGPTILEECKELRRSHLPDGLTPGEAVATGAGILPAKWIIHTAGPIYDFHRNQDALLRMCYTNSLQVAQELEARTVAFPLISAGAFGWPRRNAIYQAIQAIQASKRGFNCVMLVAHQEDVADDMNDVLAMVTT